MLHNFWYWLLEGLHNLLLALISQFPLHATIGLVDLVTTVFVYGFSILIFFVGSFFHLRFFAFIVSTIIGMEMLRLAIAIYRWILSFLPVVGH